MFHNKRNSVTVAQLISISIESDNCLTAQIMKFSTKDLFSKCEQIRRKLKKSLMENFIFCAVSDNTKWFV